MNSDVRYEVISESNQEQRYQIDHKGNQGLSSTSLVGSTRFPEDSHPVFIYLSSLSHGSRRTMKSSLDMVAGFLSGGLSDALTLDWSRMRYQHMAAVRSAVSEVYAPSTANKIISSVKGVLRECVRLDYLSPEDLSRACDVSAVKGTREPKGRALSQDELSRVFLACSSDDNSTRGTRDYAILAVMYSSGLRRSEVAALEIRDYVGSLGGNGEPDSYAYLSVRSGKGNADRTCPINSSARDSLDLWLSILYPRGSDKESSGSPLFRPISKSEKVMERGMTDQGVLYILQRRAREAGVAAFTPHDLRRTFIGDLLDRGADISTVQQLAGHANVQTTARYDRRGEQAKRKAASLLDLP
ncbi:tyrosine-type recombinase/integrase [Rubrobacter aplysinae]|uniref:tyrosine-type recombinase/integrase n=1 Tax=Rubrobacter aplysinae TaxID=909625 RepID=UPI00128C038C|nr:tyrosine-type recombinase/integrase [Rubrobacter aplysinae]